MFKYYLNYYFDIWTTIRIVNIHMDHYGKEFIFLIVKYCLLVLCEFFYLESHMFWHEIIHNSRINFTMLFGNYFSIYKCKLVCTYGSSIAVDRPCLVVLSIKGSQKEFSILKREISCSSNGPKMGKVLIGEEICNSPWISRLQWLGKC